MGKQKKAAPTKKTQDPSCAAKNRKLKAARHEKRVLMFQLRATETEKLLASAMSILGLRKAGVKRLVGTLNFNRLSDVVENKYLNSSWFIARELSKQEKKNVRKNIPSKASTEEKTVAI